MGPRLLLASASPRRLELLQRIGIDSLSTCAPNVDESARPGEAPARLVRRLAVLKARTAGEPGAVVLAADTVVVLDGEILGKPAGAADAAAMLRRLSAREHLVLTGVAVVASGRANTAVERTRVRFAELSDVEIEAYVASGEPLDKAGAYGIQGRAEAFVTRISGSYSNVVGLPLATTVRLLREAGFPA